MYYLLRAFRVVFIFFLRGKRCATRLCVRSTACRNLGALTWTSNVGFFLFSFSVFPFTVLVQHHGSSASWWKLKSWRKAAVDVVLFASKSSPDRIGTTFSFSPSTIYPLLLNIFICCCFFFLYVYVCVCVCLFSFYVACRKKKKKKTVCV